MSDFTTVFSICKLCLNVPSNSCNVTKRGPTYFLMPVCDVESCRISNSIVFLRNNDNLHHQLLLIDYKDKPFPIEITGEMEFGVTSGPHPLIYKYGHILSGDCEYCFSEHVRADQHVSPQTVADLAGGGVRGQRQLLVENLKQQLETDAVLQHAHHQKRFFVQRLHVHR